MKILYIEDNRLDADLTRRALQRAMPAIEVEVVPTQREALARLNPAQTLDYDLVLTDVRLPDGDGLAILAHILRHNLRIGVVIVSGSSNEQVVVAALKAGVADFLIKRGNYLDQLPQVLEQAYQKYQAQTERQRHVLRVLYGEDNAHDIEQTQNHLASSTPHIQLEAVGHVTLLLERLRAAPASYDLILLDYRLPGPTAWEALKELKQFAPTHAPVIFITEPGDEEVAIQALKLGAADYVLKNSGYLLRLPAVLENVFAQAQLAREQLALRESEHRYRTLVEKMGEGLLQVDTRGVVLYANTRYCELVGYPLEALLGQVAHQLVVREEDLAFIQEKNLALLAGASDRYELQLRTRTGNLIWCEISEAPLYAPDGTVLGSISIHTNITERKENELALQRFATRMEILHGIDSAILAAHSSEEIAQAALGGIRRLVPCTRACVIALNVAARTSSVLAVNPKQNTSTSISSEAVFQFLNALGQFLQGQSFITPDIQTLGLNPTFFQSLIHEGTRAFICLPLSANNQINGALMLEAAQVAAFTAEHLEIVQEISNQLAVALRQTQLFTETKDALNREQHLNSVARTVSGTLDTKEIISDVVRLAAQLVGAEAATFGLLDQRRETLSFIHAFNYPRTATLDALHKGRGGVTWSVIETGQAVMLENYSAHPQALSNSLIRAFISVPVVAHGTILGTLNLFQLNKKRAFLPRDLALAEALGQQAGVAIQNARLFEDSVRARQELMMAYDATIEGWARALDLRDQETAGHTQRVTQLTMKLAKRLGLPEADLVHLQRGALLHDIGKMGIPDEILLKPGPLTEEEFRIMRQHPQYAQDMLWPIAYLRPALEIPYCHHEKWDGTGYPRGLKGEEIPLAARVFAVVDVWDALRSTRPYRASWSESRVREHILSISGTHFDPAIVETFLPLVAESG